MASGTTTSGGSGIGFQVPFYVLNQPSYLQAVGNPINVRLRKGDYKIGDLFFVEIWKVPSKDARLDTTAKAGAILLQTLTANGNGSGECTIDISSVLATEFRHDTLTVPHPELLLQKDESAYCLYFIKAGFIQYDARNRATKVTRFESEVKVALRAATPLGTEADLTEYYYKHTGQPVKYLTRLPGTVKRKRDEHTHLPFFLPLKSGASQEAQVKISADIYYNTASPALGVELSIFPILGGGGVYLLNVQSRTFIFQPNFKDISRFVIYVSYLDEDESSWQPVTRGQEIQVMEQIQEPIRVVFLNRLGGWDSLQFTRSKEIEIKTKPQSFFSSLGQRVFQVDTTTTETYYSPYLTQSEYEWLRDLMVSPYLVIDGKVVNPNDTTFKIDSSLNLFSIQLEVTPTHKENSIKL